ncbi:zinc finger MYM-type protein 1-like [Cynara cardunculus var. scolymus]|uniref:zinc finger MYM-type protein 1-like n=1 Tax=Cynara cardunculus var. scolymus TaxID=59895 RepID=UPI000D629E0B|nr:zinc finger MYM-type protein 1-like [Cynara cardunculus var. scolymus]
MTTSSALDDRQSSSGRQGTGGQSPHLRQCSRRLGYYGQQAFTIDGFQNWKKVGGKKCGFLMHMGTECTSFHNVAQKGWDHLFNEAQDIRNVFDKFTTEEREKNRMRLTTSIYCVRWCAFQAVAFRGYTEKSYSINKGNFLEMLEALSEFSTELKELFYRVPRYASYTSPLIQKEILNLISNKVRQMIYEEIGGRRAFFGLVHVCDTTSQTLKDGIYSLLSHYNLDVKSIREQGYDGASNMQGQFKDLQALILEDCKYAYYVRCLAHRLQLALMVASQRVVALCKFFITLSFVVNVVSASSKCADQLRNAQVEKIAHLIYVDELETGRGLNQIGTLQQAGDTRWSSHLRSISSIIKMFSPTSEVLLKNFEERTGPIKRDADSAYEAMTTFEFIFVLHLEREIMEYWV